MENTENTEISQINELDLNYLTEFKPIYQNMLSEINEKKEEVNLAISQHGKSHSQFQYALLDCAGPIAGPTKARNLRQILAVISRTHSALENAYIKMRQAKAKANIYQEKADNTDGAKREYYLLKAEEHNMNSNSTHHNVLGAIRKLSTYYSQFENLEKEIRKELGKAEDEPITEKDFEEDEERFHIMKAFEQSLISARATKTGIDHGNLIYLHDIGVSGRLAQEEVLKHISTEDKFRKEHPDEIHELHAMEMRWLQEMANKYKGCAKKYAEYKGLVPGIVETSILDKITDQTNEKEDL